MSGGFKMVIFLLAALLFLLGGSLYAYRIAFFSPKKGRENPPRANNEYFQELSLRIAPLYRKLKARPCELVSIQSHDGLTLWGRYYHVKDGAPLDIGFHGYRSSAFTDFCGGSELSFAMEHNLLLVDQRAHGKSGGSTISFGILERYDVLSWVRYALERFGDDTEILLYGVSMGAATVLMAADQPFPGNVRGIIADCPYSDAMEIILHVGRSNPLPQWLIRPFVVLGARIFGGFDVLQWSAEKAVKASKIPILILHGEDDAFVPCAMSISAASANPQIAERHTFPGADHALSYLTDPERYSALVRDFAARVLQ